MQKRYKRKNGNVQSAQAPKWNNKPTRANPFAFTEEQKRLKQQLQRRRKELDDWLRRSFEGSSEQNEAALGSVRSDSLQEQLGKLSETIHDGIKVKCEDIDEVFLTRPSNE